MGVCASFPGKPYSSVEGRKPLSLIHISQLANRFVKHPLDVVKVGDLVDVRVLDVDVKREKISLTMRKEKKK